MRDVGALSPAKQALLERALRRRREAAAASTAVPRREGTGPVPLSFAQQRMWFLAQWDPGAPTFNAAKAFRLRGELDRTALKRALETVLERHESLRTVVAGGREPVQLPLPSWSFDLPVLRVPTADGPAELGRTLRQLAREPFDLTADLMLRATLIELGAADHVLLLRIHHIAADAHSNRILFEELGALYSAYRDGREPNLPELPVQYADFSVWQRQRMTGPLLAELVSYWTRQLHGAPALLRLPTDRPRPPVQRHAGAHLGLSLDRTFAERLLDVARAEGVTFFIAMLAAFATLLYRRSGEEDIVVGSPIANRNNIELQGLIGFFTNTIALRVKLAGNPTFREVLTRARETALGAYAHQDLPFEKVVEAVDPPRSPSHHPLFQVNFRAQATAQPALQLAGIVGESIPVDIGFSRFDLALELELTDGALAGYFEYDQDLFDTTTAQGFVEDLTALLEQLACDPDTPVLAVKLARRDARSSTGKGVIARRRQT